MCYSFFTFLEVYVRLYVLGVCLKSNAYLHSFQPGSCAWFSVLFVCAYHNVCVCVYINGCDDYYLAVVITLGKKM